MGGEPGTFEPGEIIEFLTETALKAKLYENLKKYELPDYLLYMGAEGANNWLALDASRTFPVARNLKTLLEAKRSALITYLPSNMNLLSVGVGSGEKERLLLEELVRKNSIDSRILGRKKLLHYYPLDLNRRFVELALEKVQDLPLLKKGFVGLVETLPTLKKHLHPPLLYCILGNTFCNYEPTFILKLLRENLEPEDLFLFDAHILSSSSSSFSSSETAKVCRAEERFLLEVYTSKENAFFNTSPLLRQGLESKAFDFELGLVFVESEFTGRLYKTKKKLHILKETQLQIGAKTLVFKKGAVIRMGFTYKYTFDQLQIILKIQGFEILKTFQGNFDSRSGTNLLVLAKKKI